MILQRVNNLMIKVMQLKKMVNTRIVTLMLMMMLQ